MTLILASSAKHSAPQLATKGNVAPIRVMLCDDSVVVRGAIAKILQDDPGIEVVARVGNGRAALEACPLHRPDVVILDIEMPIMDGLTALPLLLARTPALCVIMASTLSTRGAEISMRALRLGAADTIAKPSATRLNGDGSFGNELIAKIRGVFKLRKATPAAGAGETSVDIAYPLRSAPAEVPRLLAIGSSTGGPNALFTLVQHLGARVPVPIVLTQHMPPTFTPILAQHLGRLGMDCSEAREGDVLRPGCLLLAPGDRHLVVRREGLTMRVHLSDGPPENFCRPSVDPMLRSACEATGGRVLVAMLTGMGQDGLAGSRQVVECGGALLAQDEATSVVWGMPGAVARAGLAHAILPLMQIGPRLITMLANGSRR